jgi:hypothetical protein
MNLPSGDHSTAFTEPECPAGMKISAFFSVPQGDGGLSPADTTTGKRIHKERKQNHIVDKRENLLPVTIDAPFMLNVWTS